MTVLLFRKSMDSWDGVYSPQERGFVTHPGTEDYIKRLGNI